MLETTRRHMFLAGFMGTGKSVVGKDVARRLGWAFIDLDEYIVSLCQRSIPKIFESEGEVGFRNHEARALRLAVISPHTVISLGGGTPLRRDNANIIRSTGRTWLLTARLEVIWNRIRHEASQRPLLSGIANNSSLDAALFEDFQSAAEPMIKERSESYLRIADHVIDTSDDSIESLAAKIADQFRTGATRGARP